MWGLGLGEKKYIPFDQHSPTATPGCHLGFWGRILSFPASQELLFHIENHEVLEDFGSDYFLFLTNFQISIDLVLFIHYYLLNLQILVANKMHYMFDGENTQNHAWKYILFDIFCWRSYWFMEDSPSWA